jgi:hypothetical protein
VKIVSLLLTGRRLIFIFFIDWLEKNKLTKDGKRNNLQYFLFGEG